MLIHRRAVLGEFGGKPAPPPPQENLRLRLLPSGASSKKQFETLSPRVEPQNSSRVPFWVPRNKLDQNTGLQSRNWSPFFETTEKVSSWDSKIKMAAIRLIQNNRRRHRRQNNNNFIHRNIKDRSNPLQDYEDYEIYDRYRFRPQKIYLLCHLELWIVSVRHNFK